MVKRGPQKNIVKWNKAMLEKHGNWDYYFNKGFLVRLVERKRVSVLLNEIKAPKKAIELGCGEGFILQKFKEKFGFFPVGVDIVEQKSIHSDTDLIVADIHELPLEDNSFDIIICSEVIEHVVNPEKVLDEIKRIAKNNAHILVSFPNEKLINKLKDVLVKLRLFSFFLPAGVSKKMDDEWHLHSFDLNLFKKFLKGKMKIVKIRAVPFTFISLKYVIVMEASK